MFCCGVNNTAINTDRHIKHAYEAIWLMVRSTNTADGAAHKCLLLPGACKLLLVIILKAVKYNVIFRNNMLCSWQSNKMCRQLVNDQNIWPLTWRAAWRLDIIHTGLMHPWCRQQQWYKQPFICGSWRLRVWRQMDVLTGWHPSKKHRENACAEENYLSPLQLCAAFQIRQKHILNSQKLAWETTPLPYYLTLGADKTL